MPPLRKNTIYINAKNGEAVAFTKITNFEVRSKKFSIQLPQWWADLIGYNTVHGDTLDQVDLAFREAGERFEQMSNKKRKVILYDFQSKAMMFLLKNGGIVVGHEPNSKRDGVDLVGIDKCILRTDFGYEGGMSAEGTTALDFEYTVCYEVTNDFEKYASYVTEDGYKVADNHLDKVKVIEWTPQREQFFAAFEMALTKLIVKMHTFLYSKPETIAQQIDLHKTFAALPDNRVDK